MDTAHAKLLTIVGESILAERLIALVLAEGATGYTLSACTGRGSRGLRSTTPIDGGNLRLEVVAIEATAARILARLAAEVFPHYAVVAWASDVAVARGAKFGG